MTDQEEHELSVGDLPQQAGGLSLTGYEASLLGVAGYREQPYNPERAENQIRLVIAGGLVAVLLLCFLLAAAVILFDSKQWNNVQALLLFFLPIVAGGLGTILGFYFGTRVIR